MRDWIVILLLLVVCSSALLQIHGIINASDSTSHCSERINLSIWDGGRVNMRILPSETCTLTSLCGLAGGNGWMDSIYALGRIWVTTAFMASTDGERFDGLFIEPTGDKQ